MAAPLQLAMKQFADYDFLCSVPDTVHLPDPFNLILSFHLLGDSLGFCHLPDHQFILFIGLDADILQVIV